MATNIRIYMVVIERAADGGYGAYVPDLPGCIAAGDTREEAEQHIREAMPAHLELMREQGEPIPEPAASTVEIAA